MGFGCSDVFLCDHCLLGARPFPGCKLDFNSDFHEKVHRACLAIELEPASAERQIRQAGPSKWPVNKMAGALVLVKSRARHARDLSDLEKVPNSTAA